MTAIQLNSHERVKRIVLTAFPTYRKQKAVVSIFPENGIGINSFWDGGSRDEFSLVHLPTMTCKPLPTSSHPHFDLKDVTDKTPDLEAVNGRVTLKRLPIEFALVRAGTFVGKPATAYVYVSKGLILEAL